MKKAQEKKLDVVEMRVLRWMSGVTKLDRIRNERNYRDNEYVDKRVMVMVAPWKRRRGRPKRRWLDNIKNDLSKIIVRGGSARPGQMEASQKKKHRPHIKVGKNAEEEEEEEDEDEEGKENFA